LVDLKYSESERPIVAQIFGSNPETYYRTAQLVQELGFDGIDINMGCPDRSVSGKQASGAALIKTPRLAQKIIAETKRGAGALPVSVKTRLGFNTDTLETWLPYLLETEPAVITVHARTKKELSLVPARWERVADAVKIRDAYDSSADKTLIFGNGDVKDLNDARKKAVETGCDGIMIGRGIFGNPWLFSRERDYRTVTVEEKLAAMIEHTELFLKLLGEHKHFAIMKKHYKAYANGFDGAKELRVELMEAPDVSAVKAIVKAFLVKHPEVKSIRPW
jgi:tRNA-dihydrouridine synthase